MALGERYHKGVIERGYGDWNWVRGIPYYNLIQHAGTHLFLLGNQLSAPPTIEVASEDNAIENAAAVMWNMASTIYFLTHGNPAEARTEGDE